ncbi:MAG TPA: hypothetical protein VJO99_09285 [Burkholderiaceae bacterium]|nr:hypothetical protein [Burkholderiaceae bacterium]
MRADNKEAAKAGVVAELAKIVEAQAIHAKDREQAEGAAFAFIDLLADDETKVIQVNVHGSVSWSGDANAPDISGAAVGVSVHYAMREEPKATEDEAA